MWISKVEEKHDLGSNHLYSATPLSRWLLQIMLIRFMFEWEQHILQPLGRARWGGLWVAICNLSGHVFVPPELTGWARPPTTPDAHFRNVPPTQCARIGPSPKEAPALQCRNEVAHVLFALSLSPKLASAFRESASLVVSSSLLWTADTNRARRKRKHAMPTERRCHFQSLYGGGSSGPDTWTW
jgi:hypothetical protein